LLLIRLISDCDDRNDGVITKSLVLILFIILKVVIIVILIKNVLKTNSYA